MRFNTFHYARYFIPATSKSWNDLPSMIVEATELQKLKLGANAMVLEYFRYLSIMLTFCISFTRIFIVICFCCCFHILL